MSGLVICEERTRNHHVSKWCPDGAGTAAASDWTAKSFGQREGRFSAEERKRTSGIIYT